MPRFVDKIGEWYQFPLGIPYVSSCMKQNGLNVYTLNMNHEERDVQSALEDYIQKHDIGMVLTGELSFQYNAIKEILKAAKDYDSAIVTVAGGGIITSAPEAGMEVLEFADYGIIWRGRGDHAGTLQGGCRRKRPEKRRWAHYRPVDEVQSMYDGCSAVNLSKMPKAEMDWGAEQIMTLPQWAVLVPEKIRDVILDYERKSLDLIHPVGERQQIA